MLWGCISQYIKLMYYRDASLNTLDFYITEMHFSTHLSNLDRFTLQRHLRLHQHRKVQQQQQQHTLQHPGLFRLLRNLPNLLFRRQLFLPLHDPHVQRQIKQRLPQRSPERILALQSHRHHRAPRRFILYSTV